MSLRKFTFRVIPDEIDPDTYIQFSGSLRAEAKYNLHSPAMTCTC